MNTIRPNKNYGGPGSFVPSEGESPSGKNGVPPSLLASSSLAKLDLYNPPYDTGRRQGSGSTVDRVADEFGGLTINTDGRRRESYPVSGYVMLLISISLISGLCSSLPIEDIRLDRSHRQVLGPLIPRPRTYLRTLHRNTLMQTVNLRMMHPQHQPGEHLPIGTL